MSKRKIRKKIFNILKEISESESHNGLLVVFSDLPNIFAKGAHPLGQQENLNEFDILGNINENQEKIKKTLKKIGADGAVLICNQGNIYSPSVYLNVNLFNVERKKIEAEFCARHISALATSATTKSYVYTLSEETGKVREFIKGKIRKKYPKEKRKSILRAIERNLN